MHFWYVLYASLLIASSNTVEYSYEDKVLSHILPGEETFLQAGLEMDIISEKEAQEYREFYKLSSYSLMMSLRGRYRRCVGCPPSWDKERWPVWQTAQSIRNAIFNQRLALESRLEWDHVNSEKIRESIEYLGWSREVFDCIETTQAPYYMIAQKREALGKLRELLGEECYYAGGLPAPTIWFDFPLFALEPEKKQEEGGDEG